MSNPPLIFFKKSNLSSAPFPTKSNLHSLFQFLLRRFHLVLHLLERAHALQTLRDRRPARLLRGEEGWIMVSYWLSTVGYRTEPMLSNSIIIIFIRTMVWLCINLWALRKNSLKNRGFFIIFNLTWGGKSLIAKARNTANMITSCNMNLTRNLTQCLVYLTEPSPNIPCSSASFLFYRILPYLTINQYPSLPYRNRVEHVSLP